MNGANAGVQSLKSAVSAMSSLGGISDRTMAAVNTAAATAQMFTAGVSAIRVAGTAREMLNKKAEAEATALTSANLAIGPGGWSKIALAAGAAAAASAVTAVIMDYTLSADLESGDGRAGVTGAIGGIL